MMTVEECCEEMTRVMKRYRKGIIDDREAMTMIASVAARLVAETTEGLVKIMNRQQIKPTIEGKATLWGIDTNVTPMGERVSTTTGFMRVVGADGVEKIDIPAGAVLYVRDGDPVWPNMVLAQLN